jgi:hypothetical protein
MLFCQATDEIKLVAHRVGRRSAFDETTKETVYGMDTTDLFDCFRACLSVS